MDIHRLNELADQNQFPRPPNLQDCLHLAACSATQTLPMSADLPADLFTSCLTTPIRCALHCYLLTHRRLHRDLPVDVIERMPGKVVEKSSLVGELHWIFTAVTDTIAWTSLPRPLFQRLFRQDLLVASLCRNYLLACRLMRDYCCEPVEFF
jgi:regulator-associated protein of mTOR